jgi:penicillin V acylase-like amidase (Ntn superfamily)
MCTRILNNIDLNWVTVGRNFDWEFPLTSSVFRSPIGASRTGLSEKEMESAQLKRDQVLTWTVLYSSISILIGTDTEGYGMSDGLNTKGLVVNVLYDATTSWGETIADEQKALGLLRWGQFVLDSFAKVRDVVRYFESQPVFFVSGAVPGDDESETELHLIISDQYGDSAIIGIKQGKAIIHHSKKYTVATNQPEYKTQLSMMNYWHYQWNLNGTNNPTPVFTAPGGETPVQRFQRACFYRQLTSYDSVGTNRVAQVKGMVSTCAVPLLCSTSNAIGSNQVDLEKEDPIAATLWTSICDSTKQKYYFFDGMQLGSVWFDVTTSVDQCEITLLSNATYSLGFMSNGDSILKDCKDPFSH